MQVIPVVDLRGGVAVRAIAGRRAAYRPLVSPLAASSRPAEVVAGYLRLYPFEAVYLADLDAIEGTGVNRDTIASLAAAFPQTRFWVDAGARDAAAARDWLASAPVDCVVGSETLGSAEALRDLAREPRVILSLDFRGDEFLGPPALLQTPQLWPERVVVMTLARVGAQAGPDAERLAALKALAPKRRYYPAGGVRDGADLDALRATGAAGVLVATALHYGRLTRDDLARHNEKRGR
jgi:phosphoribosylformimino-5-aminoimidazole carboxamide ribotide isomerase